MIESPTSKNMFRKNIKRSRITTIRYILPNLPDGFWPKLKLLVSFLEEFKSVTNVFQSDTSTLFTFYVQYKSLVQKIDTFYDPLIAFHIPRIHNILIEYWEKYIDVNIIIIIAMFSFDNDYHFYFKNDKKHSAVRWFPTFASTYIQTYYPEFTKADENIETAFASFQGKLNEFSSIDNTVRESKRKHGTAFDPKLTWCNFRTIYPEFCIVVLGLLSLPISEASVERSFSLQSIAHRKLRNRLGHEKVQREMMISFNTEVFVMTG